MADIGCSVMKQAHQLDAVIRASDVKIKHLAQACDVFPDTITRWRKGVNVIPSDKLPILARELNVPISELMQWPEDVAA